MTMTLSYSTDKALTIVAFWLQSWPENAVFSLNLSSLENPHRWSGVVIYFCQGTDKLLAFIKHTSPHPHYLSTRVSFNIHADLGLCPFKYFNLGISQMSSGPKAFDRAPTK